MNSKDLIIHHNEIYENYDGLILSKSNADLKANHISQNLLNGVLLIDKSCPVMSENYIEKNEGIGVLLRDESNAKMSNNTIKNNEMDIACENKNVTREVWENNKTNDKVTNLFYKNTRCVIF